MRKTKSASKILILCRHGDREVVSAGVDSGISESGRIQAQALATTFAKKFSGQTPLVLSSPRLRCQQTLKPLATLTHSPVKIDPLLSERNSAETQHVFIMRVASFLDQIRESQEPLIISCSHGDWIPTAVDLWTGQWVDVLRGSWIELEVSEDNVKLKEVILRPQTT